jgi:hypothetical protein
MTNAVIIVQMHVIPCMIFVYFVVSYFFLTTKRTKEDTSERRIIVCPDIMPFLVRNILRVFYVVAVKVDKLVGGVCPRGDQQ